MEKRPAAAQVVDVQVLHGSHERLSVESSHREKDITFFKKDLNSQYNLIQPNLINWGTENRFIILRKVPIKAIETFVRAMFNSGPVVHFLPTTS